MAKIQDDKYYTPPDLAKYCVDKTRQIIGADNITEYIEPSAGSGVFIDYLDKPYWAYDIVPEDNRIIEADWLGITLDYKIGRCIIGNPPYGANNSLAIKFYKHAVPMCDYISFILSYSQLDNNIQMYEFDLIYSEDLGLQHYTDRNLHCCFNIYRRPENGSLNKKYNFKITKDIHIVEYRRNVKRDINYNTFDIGICGYGKGIIGNIPKYLGEYVKEFYFEITNEIYKEQIIDLIKHTDWEKEVCKGISGQVSLPQWKIHKYLKQKIPELN
ncbi:MAG: hypothetical protein NC417_07075 [Candidatus Gastranaerophilales bacterium]|nr:hypothetical protein [Candidatus Gastranaerophilales bacterium]